MMSTPLLPLLALSLALSGCQGRISEGSAERQELRAGRVRGAVAAVIRRTVGGDGRAEVDAISERQREILASADTLDVFALSANPWRGKGPDRRPRLRGSPVLGSIRVEGDTQRREVVRAYLEDARTRAPGAWCFYPRHALVATRGTERVDLLLCYECGQHQVFDSSEPDLVVPRGHQGRLGTSSAALLNRLLAEGGVAVEQPEPPPPHATLTIRSGSLDESHRVRMGHVLNGVSHGCFDQARLWEPHDAGEVRLTLRVGPGQGRTAATIDLDESPRGFGACLVRRINTDPTLFVSPPDLVLPHDVRVELQASFALPGSR